MKIVLLFVPNFGTTTPIFLISPISPENHPLDENRKQIHSFCLWFSLWPFENPLSRASLQ